MVVVLPAPLGPSRQNTRSRSMAYLRARRAGGAAVGRLRLLQQQGTEAHHETSATVKGPPSQTAEHFVAIYPPAALDRHELAAAPLPRSPPRPLGAAEAAGGRGGLKGGKLVGRLQAAD